MHTNIITYAETRLETFAVRPFCDVDSLILSWLSYYHFPSNARSWEGVPLRDCFLAETFPALFRGVWDKESSRLLLTALCASPRFRNIRLRGFTEERDTGREKQFAALTFQLTDDLAYVAFRGTDSTLIGWKEDFNMAFQCPVPSQAAAAQYLEAAAARCPGALLVGGHSKGGNLSVYAASAVRWGVQTRIRQVFSHDGPGFQSAFLGSVGYRAVQSRVAKTLPQASIVGLLLDQQDDYQVVQSTRHLGLLQHEPFSWVVDDGAFVLDELDTQAKYLDRTLDDWLWKMTPAERERFVESLYQLLSSTSITDLSEFKTDWQKKLPALMQAARSLDPDTRAFFFRVVKELASIGAKNYQAFYMPRPDVHVPHPHDHKPHLHRKPTL